MKPVIIHPAADAEVEHEVDYYELQSTGLGRELRIELESVVADILARPNANGKYPGTTCRAKMLHRFPFSVIYRDRPAALYVYALAHHKRQPGYWKARLRQLP